MPTPSASSAGVTARVVNLFSPPGSWGEETKMTEDEFKDQSWKLPLWAPHMQQANFWHLNPAGSVTFLGWIMHCHLQKHRPNASRWGTLQLWAFEFFWLFPEKFHFSISIFFLLEKFLEKHYERSSGVTSQSKKVSFGHENQKDSTSLVVCREVWCLGIKKF